MEHPVLLRSNLSFVAPHAAPPDPRAPPAYAHARQSLAEFLEGPPRCAPRAPRSRPSAPGGRQCAAPHHGSRRSRRPLFPGDRSRPNLVLVSCSMVVPGDLSWLLADGINHVAIPLHISRNLTSEALPFTNRPPSASLS